MFRLFLLLGFTFLYAIPPIIKVEYVHSDDFDIRSAREDVPLYEISIDNPDSVAFRLKIQPENKCSFKRTKGNTALPLTTVSWRYENTIHETKVLWERKSPEPCNEFYIDFSKDIRKYYRIQLLGSWGNGGDKLLAGTYKESVTFTILSP